MPGCCDAADYHATSRMECSFHLFNKDENLDETLRQWWIGEEKSNRRLLQSLPYILCYKYFSEDCFMTEAIERNSCPK